MVSATGMKAIPICNGSRPRTRCRYRELMKKKPSIPATSRNWIRLAPHTLRGRNMLKGRSGFCAVAWRATNPTSSRTESKPNPMVWTEAQP